MATLQMGTALRTARSAVIETTIGTSPHIYIRTGGVETNPSDADSGTLLATVDLPSDWCSQSSGTLTFLSLPLYSNAAVAAGAAAHYRIKDSAGSVVHMQGDVSVTGGGGSMTIDDVNVLVGRILTITGWQIVEGNL